MIPVLAASIYRRINELGLFVGACGALVIAWGAYSFLTGGDGGDSRRRERTRTVVGSVLIALGFAMILLAMVAAPATGPSPSPTPISSHTGG